MSGLCVGSTAGPRDIISRSTICTFLADKNNKAAVLKQRTELAKDAMDNKRIIGVVVHGNHPSLALKNIISPDGEAWAVMGFFVLTDAWLEKSEDKMCLLGRLEKVDDEDIWWEARASSTPTTLIPSPSRDVCSFCSKPLQKRYVDVEAFCDQPRCPSALKPVTSSDDTLTYEMAYLDQVQVTGPISLRNFSLLPPQPKQLSFSDFKENLIPRTSHTDRPSKRKIMQPKKGLDDAARADQQEQRLRQEPGMRDYMCHICK